MHTLTKALIPSKYLVGRSIATHSPPVFPFRVRSQKVGKNGWADQALTMTTLEQFKQVRTSVAPEVQSELFLLMSKDPDAAISRMVEIAGEKGLTVSSEEVRGFLRAMDDDEEFDDIELDAIALTAIAGGGYGRSAC